MEATDPNAPRGVGFRAQPGDVSIHYGDVMHAAPPPTRADLDTYRISAVTGFAHPASRNHRGANEFCLRNPKNVCTGFSARTDSI